MIMAVFVGIFIAGLWMTAGGAIMMPASFVFTTERHTLGAATFCGGVIVMFCSAYLIS